MKKVFFAIGVLSIMASCANNTTPEGPGVDSTTVILPETCTGMDSVAIVDTTAVDTASAE